MNATRICFRTDESIVYTLVDAGEIYSAIDSSNATRYKFQTDEKGKWADLSRYFDVFPADRLLKSLREEDPISLKAADRAILVEAARRRPQTFIHTIAHMHRRAIDRYMRNPGNADVGSTIAALESLIYINSPLREYAETNLRLHNVVSQHVKHSPVNASNALDAIAKFVEGGHRCLDNLNGNIAVNIMRGKFCSLTDRRAAEDLFEKAVTRDTDNVIADAFIDIGASTYFSDQLQDDVRALTRAKEVRSSPSWLDATHRANSTAIVVSVDPAFFRIYGPSLLWLAQQLPDIDFIFVLCGGEEIFGVIEAASAFQSELGRFNQSGTPENIRYMQMPVPEWVAVKETFYASARFFAINMIAEIYPFLYLMDADLVADADPRPYLKKLRAFDFAVPMTRGIKAVSPWRRYMAGNVSINERVLESPLVEELQTYLARGLSLPNSWMLDQNALAYSIERNNFMYTDLNIMQRPFSQPSFRSVAERSFKVSNKGK